MEFNELNFLSELNDFMNAEEEKSANISAEEVNDNTFCIKTLDQADYILRRYNETKAEIESIKEIAKKRKEDYCERVDRFVESNTKGALSSLAYLESLLRTFAEDYTKDKKSRSIKLVEGTISLSKQKHKYVYDDEKLLIWLKENSKEYVKEKLSFAPDKEKLKKVAEIQGDKLILNGKIVEGVDIIEQKDSFKVKPSL